MKLTNRHNLPQSVYNLLAKERYSGGSATDYSVTTLLQPPRITQLKRRYWDQLEEDVMDNVWSLFGHVAHSLLEEHGADNALSEERIHTTILDRNISGQVDSYHEGIITDYKVTSAWTLVYGSRLAEWTEQLNLYSYLFQQAGHEVKELRICAILRDWDKNKAKQDTNYPQTPIVIIPITLWSFPQVEAYAYERVIIHKDAESKSDDLLPECSEGDMWCQSTKYALMKEGSRRAIKVEFTLADLAVYCDNNKLLNEQGDKPIKGYFFEERQGKRTRCEDGYCAVSKYCTQYQLYLKRNEYV